LRGWHFSGYGLDITMPRLFLTLLLIGAGVSAAHGRTLAELRADGDAVVGAKPKRVLFRTDSPRLFAPNALPPARPVTTPASARRPKQPAAASPSTPAPKARVTTIAPAPILKPQLRQRTSISVPLREEAPRFAPRFAPRSDIDFHPTTFTPYDRYLGTVKAVIARLDERNASMVTACELVRECRNFGYKLTDLYRADPPSVTGARRSGDCKSKALWVYDHLGDPQAYYVIGKLVMRSRTSHAWVYWRNNGRWWILDPTVRSAPIAADSVSSARYVPYYSFSRAGAFRHNATRLLVAANGIPAVTPTAAVRERSVDSSAGAAPRK